MSSATSKRYPIFIATEKGPWFQSTKNYYIGNTCYMDKVFMHLNGPNCWHSIKLQDIAYIEFKHTHERVDFYQGQVIAPVRLV